MRERERERESVFRAKKLMVYGEAEDKHQSTGSNNSVGTCK